VKEKKPRVKSVRKSKEQSPVKEMPLHEWTKIRDPSLCPKIKPVTGYKLETEDKRGCIQAGLFWREGQTLEKDIPQDIALQFRRIQDDGVRTHLGFLLSTESAVNLFRLLGILLTQAGVIRPPEPSRESVTKTKKK